MATGSLVVLGLGNLLCADDGLGVVAAHELERRYTLPEGVRVLDGGTLGLALLAHLRGVEDLVLLDAIRAEAPPGTLVRLAGEEVGPAVRERLSVHQVGVADLLEALRLLDAFPQRLCLLGLVPESLELHVGCSPQVELALPALIEATAAELGRLGYPLVPRWDHETLSAMAGPAPRPALALE